MKKLICIFLGLVIAGALCSAQTTGGTIGGATLTQNNTFTGTNTFAGAITTQSENGDLWVGTAQGQFSSMSACYAALAVGQACHVPSGWTETFAANLVLSKNNAGFIFHGCNAVITMGSFQITQASSVLHNFIRTPCDPGPNTAGVRFLYTGNTTAFSIGDTTTTLGGDIFEGFVVNIQGAGSAAIGITATQLVRSAFTNVQVFGTGGAVTQIGFLFTDGGGALGTFNNVLTKVQVTNTQTGIKCVGTTSACASNTHILYSFGTTSAGSIGFDCQSCESNTFWDADIEGVVTALNFSNIAGSLGNRCFGCFFQSNTTDIVFGAASHDNWVDVASPNAALVTDNSTPAQFNGVWSKSTYTVNKLGQLIVGPGSATVPWAIASNLAVPGPGPFFNGNNLCMASGAFSMECLLGASSGVFLRTNGVFGWPTSGDPDSGAGTGFSLISTGVVGVGNGTAGSTTGTLQATTLAISGTVKNIANTATMGLTLKKGSGGGNYTSASTTYVVVDSTNLCFTVTIPTGWKLSVVVNGAIGTATGAVNASLALTDNAACSTANAGILVETTETTTGASVLQPVGLGWIIAGDGASHNVALQFKTSNAADSATLLNSSATSLPTMVFTLMPSN